MREKLLRELKRTEVCLDVAKELSFTVWASLEIKGEEYNRLQSEVDSAVDKLRGRFAALDELDKQVNPDRFENYFRLRKSYWKYSELAEKLEAIHNESMRELRQGVYSVGRAV